MKKLKKINRSTLIKKLDIIIRAVVKARDNYTCQRCSKKVEGTNCHASHVIPISHGNNLRWDPINMKVLCYHCHINWWHKNPTESGEWFRNKFPERQKYLDSEKNKLVQFKDWQLEVMLVALEQRLDNEISGI